MSSIVDHRLGSAVPRRGRPKTGDAALEALGVRDLDRRRVFSDRDADAPTSPALRRRLAAVGAFAPEPRSAPRLMCMRCPRQLSAQNGDVMEKGLCKSCMAKWEASMTGKMAQSPATPGAGNGSASEEIVLSALEKSIIGRVYGHMPTSELLKTLNSRRVAAEGPAAVLLGMDVIHKEVNKTPAVAPAGALDYPALRKLLSQAKKDGTLDLVTEQVIDDFAVIFSLTAKQVMGLKGGAAEHGG